MLFMQHMLKSNVRTRTLCENRRTFLLGCTVCDVHCFLWVETVWDALLDVKHMVTPTVESCFFKSVKL